MIEIEKYARAAASTARTPPNSPARRAAIDAENAARVAAEQFVKGLEAERDTLDHQAKDALVEMQGLRAQFDALKRQAESEYEVRADGETVRKDRWEVGIRRIVALIWGNRHEFEVADVVDAVRVLVPAPNEDDEALVQSVLGTARPVPAQIPDGLRLVMQEARDTFAFYAESHRARGPEHAEKAARNEAMAAKINAVLAAPEAAR
jgi:hypothetical protein